MAPTPSLENGPAARSFAADAHGLHHGPGQHQTPEYKSVGAMFGADWRVPLGSSSET